MDMLESIGRKPSLWRRFRDWLQRDVEITIWEPRKGLIKEKDLQDVFIKGKLYATDDQETRKLSPRGPNSFVVTINPRFVSALCPFHEKHTVQQLIKQEDGTYLLTVRGVPNHE